MGNINQDISQFFPFLFEFLFVEVDINSVCQCNSYGPLCTSMPVIMAHVLFTYHTMSAYITYILVISILCTYCFREVLKLEPGVFWRLLITITMNGSKLICIFLLPIFYLKSSDMTQTSLLFFLVFFIFFSQHHLN